MSHADAMPISTFHSRRRDALAAEPKGPDAMFCTRTRRLTLILFVLLATVGLFISARAPLASASGSVPAATNGVVYAVNNRSDTVTPINTATDTADPPIPVGSSPSAIAITPNGQTAYVANIGDGTVTPISTATNTAGSAISVGQLPSSVAIMPDGKTAYVANTGDNTVTPISTSSGTPGTPIPVGKGPLAIAVTPTGQTAYVANAVDGTVTPISTASNTAGQADRSGQRALCDRRHARWQVPLRRQLSRQLGHGGLCRLATRSLQPFRSAAIPIRSPSRRTVRPPMSPTTATRPSRPSIRPPTVRSLSLRCPAILTAISVGPSGSTAYVSYRLSPTPSCPIYLATDTVETPVTVGSNAYALAVTPDQAPSRLVHSDAERGGPADLL